MPRRTGRGTPEAEKEHAPEAAGDGMNHGWLDATRDVAARTHLLLAAMTLDEKVSQLWHDTPAIERLGVEAYDWWNEALHGVARAGKATVFPQAIGLAATFDEALVGEIASAIGREARAKGGGLTFWSPNVNIYRDPRWGRGQETWGEDPHLTSRLGTAFVRGLQGDDPERLQAAACAKHFLAHSGPEQGRASFDASVSARDLRETYLPAFAALVREGKVAGVMCAYNAVNGAACCGSPKLLRALLRDELGFEGYVVTDCWAGELMHSHHHEADTCEAAVAKAVKAGVNLFCGSAREALAKALADGLLDEADLDEALSPSLRVRFRLGHFDPPGSATAVTIDLDAHARLAREAAVRSCVLLKNEGGVLPLARDLERVYVTGPTATSIEAILGNYHGVHERLVTVLEGVTAKVGLSTSLVYAKGCPLSGEAANPTEWACHYAKDADVTIAVVGLTTDLIGEDGDAILSEHAGDWPSLRLPAGQVEYVKALRKGHEQPIVLVVTSGVPLILDDVEPYVDAILLAWHPGQEGGNAVADLLFGDANPSGRMPVTVPRTIEDLPPFADYSMRGRTYRFADAEPLYPFGAGLGYTTFAYHDVAVEPGEVAEDQAVEVSVAIENTGPVAGTEIVLLYLTDPRDDADKPRRSLKGIERIALEPGARTTVRFTLPPESRQVVEADGSTRQPKGTWTASVSPWRNSGSVSDTGPAFHRAPSS